MSPKWLSCYHDSWCSHSRFVSSERAAAKASDPSASSSSSSSSSSLSLAPPSSPQPQVSRVPLLSCHVKCQSRISVLFVVSALIPGFLASPIRIRTLTRIPPIARQMHPSLKRALSTIAIRDPLNNKSLNIPIPLSATVTGKFDLHVLDLEGIAPLLELDLSPL